MMRLYKKPLLYVILMFFVFGLFSCNSESNQDKKTKTVKVEIIDSNYMLTVDGEPFYVKGAGCEFGNIAALAQHGANSFRTWRTDNGKNTGQEVLDEAQKHGLMVVMGIEIERERHGFNYSDPDTVKKQFEYVKGEVLNW